MFLSLPYILETAPLSVPEKPNVQGIEVNGEI